MYHHDQYIWKYVGNEWQFRDLVYWWGEDNGDKGFIKLIGPMSTHDAAELCALMNKLHKITRSLTG